MTVTKGLRVSRFTEPLHSRCAIKTCIETFTISLSQIMRVLCGKHGWSTDGEPVNTTVSEGKTSLMWTLTRKIQ